MELQQLLEQGSVYIKHILSIGAYVYPRSSPQLVNTLRQLQFWSKQLFATTEQLTDFTDDLAPKTIHYVTDHLDMNWIFLRVEDYLMLIGPFRTKEQNRHGARELVAMRGLPVQQTAPFLLYSNTFTLLPVQAALQSAYAVFKNVYGTTTDVVVNLIHLNKQSLPIHHAPDAVLAVDALPSISEVEYTHDLEARFMDEVTRGNASEANILLAEIARRTSPQYDDQGLQGLKTGFAISRTETRIAAKNAGVPSSALDALSREFSLRSFSISSIADLNALTFEMVERFCELVRERRASAYSPIIRKATHYILQHLTKPLRVEEIARVVGVSPNHLSSTFRKEVGETLTTHVQRLRLEQAKHLLTYTERPVQEISAEVGITDNNYFAKLFRKAYHMSPSEYRQELFQNK